MRPIISLFFFMILLLNFSSLMAQDSEDDPLIPARQNSASQTPFQGIKDPFQPRPRNVQTSVSPAPTLATPTPPAQPIISATPATEENADVVSSPKIQTTETTTDPSMGQSQSITEEEDPFAQDLFQGNDEEFKPAPLKIGSEQSQQEVKDQATETKAQEPSPTLLPTPSETPTPLEISPTPLAVPEKRQYKQTQELIKPSELVTEEIDPWDDPRKNVSTTCRLHLERIKKKKRMLEKAEGTQLKVKEALASKKGDQSSLKEVSIKLETKISDIARELKNLKEKTIRLGCPGVEY